MAKKRKNSWKSLGAFQRERAEMERATRARALADAIAIEATKRRIAEEEARRRAELEKLPEKSLSVTPTKTLTLKPRGVEQGGVRQSFSHGRTKQVLVEKIKSRAPIKARADPDFDEAVRQLERARKSGADRLDLSMIGGLQKLPPFGKTDGLRVINLSGTKIADLSSISALLRIEDLNISGTPVEDLSPVRELPAMLSINASGTQVSDLSPLSELKRLKRLQLSKAPITNLGSLSHQPYLQHIDISRTSVSDFSPLAEFMNLQILDLSDTQIKDLSPLTNLTRLQDLDIGGCKVSDLSPIAALTGLRRLNLNGTQVSDLLPIAKLASLAEGAKSSPRSQGIGFRDCPIVDIHLRAFADMDNPQRTIDVINYVQRRASQIESDRKDNESDAAPPAEVIPTQLKAAISFTSANSGPLDVLSDDIERAIDPEQAQLYGRMREQLSSMLEQVPGQERTQVTEPIEDFLREPAIWAEVKFKKLLWLCGNSLRNVLSQHDAVSSDPEFHYAKLPPATAEVLRRPVETWNIVVLGDPTLRELDAQRLGPQERQAAKDQIEAAKPILDAAADDRRITTTAAAATIKASLAAAEAPADNIHTQQAQALARGTSQNFVVQVMRGAYRTAQELQDPQSEEAKTFVKEYKAGAYKKLGEWTITGSVVAAGGAIAAAGTALYYASTPFFEFVVTQGPWLKAYLAIAFDNPQLVQIIDWMTGLRAKLLMPPKAAN
jgi:Leucine Rich repeats (2 copies)/Bacterial translation initiation factor IF-2 associated region